MTRHELRDLRWTLRSVVDQVASTGVAVVIADDNTDVAVIVSMSDYERLRANRPLLSRISAGPGGGGFGLAKPSHGRHDSTQDFQSPALTIRRILAIGRRGILDRLRRH